MIHYSCDCCKRTLDPTDDLRYVVKIEVMAAMDQDPDLADDDMDNFLEVQNALQRMEDQADAAISDDVYKTLRYDLCPECRKKFLKNPLGREMKQFKFSAN
jgi:hypothetical protein